MQFKNYPAAYIFIIQYLCVIQK